MCACQLVQQTRTLAYCEGELGVVGPGRVLVNFDLEVNARGSGLWVVCQRTDGTMKLQVLDLALRFSKEN